MTQSCGMIALYWKCEKDVFYMQDSYNGEFHREIVGKLSHANK